MNKKQKAVVILWALLTGLIALLIASELGTPGSAGSWKNPLVIWIGATLMSGAFWWVFMPNKNSS